MSDGISISITVEDSAVIAKFDSMDEDLHDELLKACTELARDVADVVRRKLSGDVLGVVTGNLRRSIFQDTQDLGKAVFGRVYGAADVPYGGIHEFGGMTSPHEIIARNAKALRFIMGGAEVYRQRVNHPGSKFPERSFMRSSFDDMKTEIEDRLRAAVLAAVQRS
jgi:phage gpG-like protein